MAFSNGGCYGDAADDDNFNNGDDNVDDSSDVKGSCYFGPSAKRRQLPQLFMTMIVLLIRNYYGGGARDDKMI